MRTKSKNKMYILIEDCIKTFNSITGNCNCSVAFKHLQHCSYDIDDAVKEYNYYQNSHMLESDFGYHKSKSDLKKRIEILDSSTNFISKLGSSKSTNALTIISPTSNQSKFSCFFNCSGSENSRSTSDQNIEEQNFSQTSEEVKLKGCETFRYQERKSIQPSVDSHFVELKDIINSNKFSKSVARSNRISRNEIGINAFDSCEAYDCDENKVQSINSSGLRHLITNQAIFNRFSIKI